MSDADILKLVIGLLFGLPLLAYLCLKFGTYGFYKARQKANKLINVNRNDTGEPNE